MDDNPGEPFSPTTNAGADQSASTGAAVTLSATATGAWGDNVTWQWTQVDGASSSTAATDGVTLTDATSATASFTAPSMATTLYLRLIATPELGATNGAAANAADWVMVAAGTNQAPAVANEIPDWAAPTAGLPTVSVHDAQGYEGDASALRITVPRTEATSVRPRSLRYRVDPGCDEPARVLPVPRAERDGGPCRSGACPAAVGRAIRNRPAGGVTDRFRT